MPKSKNRKQHSTKVAQRNTVVAQERIRKEKAQAAAIAEYRRQIAEHAAQAEAKRKGEIASLAKSEPSDSGALVSAIDGVIVDSEPVE